MKSHVMLLMATTLLLSTVSLAGNKNSDPVGDIDKKPGAWCEDLQTDLVSTDFNRVGDEFVVQMEMTKEIKKDVGYKEYYFWLDINHPNGGYQPYNPQSVAWPDLQANYRIYYSINANVDSDEPVDEKIAYQPCMNGGDCSQDQGMLQDNKIKVSIDKKTVTFRWPVSLLPEMAKAKNIRVGYTTYFEHQGCNGEDDSPQWGRNAFKINLQPALPLPPAPPAL